MKPRKGTVIYWSNQSEDDYDTGTHRARVYGRVKIERHGLYAALSNIFFYGLVVPIIWVFLKVTGVKVQGKEKLKPLKKAKTGYFMMCNHAGIKDVTIPYLLGLPTRVNTVGYSNAEDGFLLRHIVPLLGYFPIPDDPHDLPVFKRALVWSIKEKHQPVCIYPEAHLWPMYTGVREFSRVSFRYPVDLDVPVVPLFIARRKRRGFWKLFKHPRLTCIVGDPLYPAKEGKTDARVTDLRDRCYRSMVDMSRSIEQEDYYRYVYRPLRTDGGEKGSDPSAGT